MSASPRRAPSLLESFNFAFEGVIHVLRTQRNMRIHFGIAAAVLIAAVALGVGRIELIALMIAISFVLIAEMINSALEAGIDVATTSFDPLAKLAKDIAAGAVLIATVNAVAVGYLVFSDQVFNRELARDRAAARRAVRADADRARADASSSCSRRRRYTGRGTPLRGGLPSGHAAVAFGGWMAVTQVVGDSPHWFLVSSLTLLMAMLVAQTRLEVGRPLVPRGHVRGAPRLAGRARHVPGVRVSDDLYDRAVAIAERAYAPYSSFLVGAAVRARDGRVFEGVNVENAAYPLGICAERTAIASSVVAGCRPGDLEAIAVTASPCGGCRQWIHEFRIERVTYRNAAGEVVTKTPDELLPDTFEL